MLSDLTLLELDRAPETVRALLDPIPEEYSELVRLSEEAEQLARRYLETEVVGPASRVDAQHIAVATVARVDVLVSWNFKHIVNLDRIRGFNAVNLLQGYPPIEIRTPRELLSYEP